MDEHRDQHTPSIHCRAVDASNKDQQHADHCNAELHVILCGISFTKFPTDNNISHHSLHSMAVTYLNTNRVMMVITSPNSDRETPMIVSTSSAFVNAGGAVQSASSNLEQMSYKENINVYTAKVLTFMTYHKYSKVGEMVTLAGDYSVLNTDSLTSFSSPVTLTSVGFKDPRNTPLRSK